MPLHPFREALGQAGLRAFHHESSFKAEADAALARFQTTRDDLERQVRRGDLTLKVAREKTQAAADYLKTSLRKQAEGYSPVARVFLDRLVEASNFRRRSREHVSIEGLQRETNRLLRQSLVEQQLMNRAKEFEGKTFVRSMTGGQPTPTLESLLAFHETAEHAGDEAAQEWARRQLEGLRNRVIDPVDQRKIDLACDRLDAVNPRLVATYMDAMKDSDSTELETFVAQALEGRDANACVASFLLARDASAGVAARWVRDVLNGLNSFPDAALATLRAIEADDRNADAAAAKAQAEYAVALAEAQVRFTGVEPPTDDDLARQARLRAKPTAKLGEPVGLALERRGPSMEELEDAWADGLD